ncbi:hypothetical protein BH09GEM1_BH09GEM1_22500 [soil metagenome]
MRTATPTDIGALIRDARLAAGLSQTELGERIGASRFWVAEFERGKPRAELGLALEAIRALGLVLSIERKDAVSKREKARQTRSGKHRTPQAPAVDLASVIERATLKVDRE